jgi:hypothetical protein
LPYGRPKAQIPRDSRPWNQPIRPAHDLGVIPRPKRQRRKEHTIPCASFFLPPTRHSPVRARGSTPAARLASTPASAPRRASPSRGGRPTSRDGRRVLEVRGRGPAPAAAAAALRRGRGRGAPGHGRRPADGARRGPAAHEAPPPRRLLRFASAPRARPRDLIRASSSALEWSHSIQVGSPTKRTLSCRPVALLARSDRGVAGAGHLGF